MARVADFRGSFRTKNEPRIDALYTYCRACRPVADVSNSDRALGSTTRLRNGGDRSVRAKRKTPAPPAGGGAKIVLGGNFTRYSLKGDVAGSAHPPVQDFDHAVLPSWPRIVGGIRRLALNMPTVRRKPSDHSGRR